MIAMPKSKLDLPALDVGADNIGKHLAMLRKRAGLTQVQLAEKMGIIQVLVSNYESNRLRLNAEMILRFAQALNVSTDELLGYAQSKVLDEEMPLRITKRMKQIQDLPESKQRALLQTIDAYLQSSKSN